MSAGTATNRTAIHVTGTPGRFPGMDAYFVEYLTLRHHWGVHDEDDARLLPHLRRLANEGVPDALYRLSLLLMGDLPVAGVEKNRQTARDMMIRAEEKGSESAKCLRAVYRRLIGGSVPEEDMVEALEWLRVNASLGEAECQCVLGMLYLTGFFGYPTDRNRAAVYFEQAVDQGHILAHYDLGRLQERGIESRDDIETVEHVLALFEYAADHGFIAAQNHLGEIYEKGAIVDQDYQRAKVFFEAAAEQGDSMAQINLCNMYLKGKGVEQNVATACELALRAAGNDDRPNLAERAVRGLLRFCRKLMSDVTFGVDWNLATQVSLALADLGYHRVSLPMLYELALGFESGIDGIVEKDFPRAKFLLKRAADLDHADSLAKLGFMHQDGTHDFDTDIGRVLSYLFRAASLGHFGAITCLCSLEHSRSQPQDSRKRKR